jgi:hypothetical protein
VSVFGAFFDAAGSEDDGKAAIFVSGFISTHDRWKRFERNWLALLKRFDIEPPFHMSEFACGHGQYAPWRKDEERRKLFMTRAVDITLQSVLWSFSSGIILADYDRVNTEFHLEEAHGGKYAMCALGSMTRMVGWMRKRDIETAVAVFEDGDNGRGDFIDRYRAATGRSPHMVKKGEYVELQAADILAYEHAKLVRDKESGRAKRLEDVRIPFKRFEADKRITWGYHNESSLRKFVARSNVARRLT